MRLDGGILSSSSAPVAFLSLCTAQTFLNLAPSLVSARQIFHGYASILLASCRNRVSRRPPARSRNEEDQNLNTRLAYANRCGAGLHAIVSVLQSACYYSESPLKWDLLLTEGDTCSVVAVTKEEEEEESTYTSDQLI